MQWLGKTNTIILNVSPSSFSFTQLLLLSMMPYGLGSPAGQLGSAVPALCSPSLLGTPSLFVGGVKSEKGLDPVWALLSRTQSIHVTNTFLVTNYTHNTKAATMKKLTLSPLKAHTKYLFPILILIFSTEHFHIQILQPEEHLQISKMVMMGYFEKEIWYFYLNVTLFENHSIYLLGRL